jgi:phosphohistidine phosphatase
VMAATHLLLVLRHAKAARDPADQDDQRPLTGRGRRDAAAAGTHLLENGLIPVSVRCSVALRTRQTWEQVCAALGATGDRAEVSFEPRLYRAGSEGLLAVVREAADESPMVLLVGHNPAVHDLVVDLTGAHVAAFPTAALAVVGLPGSWRDAAPGSGELISLWAPGN